MRWSEALPYSVGSFTCLLPPSKRPYGVFGPNLHPVYGLLGGCEAVTWTPNSQAHPFPGRWLWLPGSVPAVLTPWGGTNLWALFSNTDPITLCLPAAQKRPFFAPRDFVNLERELGKNGPPLSRPLIQHAQDRINLGKPCRGESNSNLKNLLIKAGFRNSISLNVLAGSPGSINIATDTRASAFFTFPIKKGKKRHS